MKTYIHYGATEYNSERFRPIVNERGFPKPHGGLWASNIRSEYGWKEWCESENFRECNEDNSFTFTLKPEARVIFVTSMAAIKELPRVQEDRIFSGFGKILLDFEKMVKMGIDAIEVSITDFPEAYNLFYGWDCDSIVILNKDIVVVEKVA